MLALRELSRSDLESINSWRADKDLISFLGAPFRYINQEVDYRWFDTYMNNRHNTIRCAIYDDAGSGDTSILGMVALTNIDWVVRSAVLHIMIGNSDNRNRGIGTFAVSEILKHAFDDMNLNRVELEVLSSNSRAIHLYEKIGFVKEGIKKEAAYKNGFYADVLFMGLLKKQWEKKHQENH